MVVALALPVAVIIVAVIIAALLRRKMVVAVPLGLVAAIASLSIGRMLGLIGGGLSLSAVIVPAACILLAVLISPKKPKAAEAGQENHEPVQLSEPAEQTVEIDEAAFQQWLEARGLTKTDLTPARLLDLRRQFAGLA